jgi:O-antigen/teichoic acid export membrane protein
VPLKRVSYQLIANFTGNAWTSLLALAFVPLNIRFLGIDAFGLVGFYTTLQNVMMLLDLGVTPTINRELARHSAVRQTASGARDLVRTFEPPYWVVGIALGAVLAASAGMIATFWIRSDRLPVEEVRRAVALMGLSTALQWPLSFYQGGLMGLQRPILLQGVNAAAATVRGVGAVLVLWLVSPTITAFFVWQAISAALHTLTAAACLWHVLPPAPARARFRSELLRDRWRFSAGVGLTSAVALLLTQMDKVVLSKVVSLQAFGYYVLAGTMADVLYKLVTPVNATLFPRFSALAAAGEWAALQTLYHRSCQLVSAMVVPAAVTLAVFAHQLITIWTGDPQLADGAAPIVKVLAVGTALNGLMSLPYAAQLAHGWVRLTLLVNIISLIVIAPVTALLAVRFGPMGAAFAWVALNAIYVLVAVPLMHRRLFRGQMGRWYAVDVAAPAAAGTVMIAIAASVMPAPLSTRSQMVVIAFTYAAAACAAAMAAPELRMWLLTTLRRETGRGADAVG